MKPVWKSDCFKLKYRSTSIILEVPEYILEGRNDDGPDQDSNPGLLNLQLGALYQLSYKTDQTQLNTTVNPN